VRHTIATRYAALRACVYLNPLEYNTYSATSNNGTLAFDGWALTFDTAMRRLGGAEAHPGPSSLQCNSSPINGYCTNHRTVYNGALLCGFNVPIKVLNSTPTSVDATLYRSNTVSGYLESTYFRCCTIDETCTAACNGVHPGLSCRLKACIQTAYIVISLGARKKSNLSGINPANPNQSAPNLANMHKSMGNNVQKILGAITPVWSKWGLGRVPRAAVPLAHANQLLLPL